MAKIKKTYNGFLVTFNIHNFVFPKYWSCRYISECISGIPAQIDLAVTLTIFDFIFHVIC